MDAYFDSYSDLSLQRFMVSDAIRTDAFAWAIKEVVKPGNTVIDVGTGTGLLAMLSAKAGAEKVYALEQSDIHSVAKRTVERNGLSEVVEVIKTNANDFQLTDEADIIVSEWIGHFAFAETMLDDVIACRNANLKPGGIMLPAAMELLLAPLDSTLLYDDYGPGYWIENVHGLDFSHLEEEELEQAIATKTVIPPEALITPGKVIHHVDLATASAEDCWTSGKVEYDIERNCLLDGLGGWFKAILSPSITLDTSPEEPETHWQQTYMPIRPTTLEAGQKLVIEYSLSKHPVIPRSLELRLQLEGQTYHYTIG